MATVQYTVCDRCEAKSTQENVRISKFSFDLCHTCQDELKALFNNSIHARLLAGAKALEDLADDRAAHLADSLREIEENISGDI